MLIGQILVKKDNKDTILCKFLQMLTDDIRSNSDNKTVNVIAFRIEMIYEKHVKKYLLP